MKIGMIFECGPKGADKAVCEHLARMVATKIKIDSVTSGNKPMLLAECGKNARLLLSSGCERVLIIWDHYPPWREDRQRPCRKEDRDAIFRSLDEAGVNLSKVYLICIHEELESWLLADSRAISDFLSKPHRPIKIRSISKPEALKNPKKHLTRIFRENIHQPYVDVIHAERIVRKMRDLSHIERCPTFVRFRQKIVGG